MVVISFTLAKSLFQIMLPVQVSASTTKREIWKRPVTSLQCLHSSSCHQLLGHHRDWGLPGDQKQLVRANVWAGQEHRELETSPAVVLLGQGLIWGPRCWAGPGSPERLGTALAVVSMPHHGCSFPS